MAAKTFEFVWVGTDKRGKETNGELEATSVSLAKAQLRRRGINVKSIKKKAKPLFGGGGKKIKPADIALFTRQLATMMKAGVPLIQSFEIVADGIENTRMRSMVNSIRGDVAAGNALAGALAKHKDQFDELFCSLVNSGENSGTLETMLDRVATYKEKTEQLKAKIKKAMTYPIAVVIVAIAVTSLLLIKVVPQFAETFQSFGSELPAFTLFVMGISDAAQEWWFIWLVSVIAAFFAFKEAKRRSKKFDAFIDKYSLKIPVVGNILYQAINARFARTLSTTFAAGVPLVDALTSVAGASGNAVYREAILKVRDDVTTGLQLNHAMRSTGRFPVMMLQMTAIGEESGALDEMLEKAAIHYEEAVDNAVDNLTTLLEPMIMAVLGVLVGGLLIAMYLPIFKLGAVI